MKLLKKWDFISSDNKIGIYKELAHYLEMDFMKGLIGWLKLLKLLINDHLFLLFVVFKIYYYNY